VWLTPTARVLALNSLIWTAARTHPHATATLHRVIDRWIPDGAVLLAGDSLIGQLPPRLVDSRAVNLAVGGVRTAEVRVMLREKNSPARSRALVLLVGTNDLVRVDSPSPALRAELSDLLAGLPATLPVVLCAVPPIDPRVHRDRTLSAIAELNRAWAALAATRPRTHFVPVATLADDAGQLRADVHQGDGLHLNANGNAALAAALRAGLAKVASE
jgi:lysophospholipase L1-like esterase